jgi:hypothetical protein
VTVSETGASCERGRRSTAHAPRSTAAETACGSTGARQCPLRCPHAARALEARCCVCLNVIARSRSFGALAALFLIVHPSSDRTLDPVRRDNSFAEKQESHAARLLVVRSDGLSRTVGDPRIHSDSRSEDLASILTVGVERVGVVRCWSGGVE